MKSTSVRGNIRGNIRWIANLPGRGQTDTKGINLSRLPVCKLRPIFETSSGHKTKFEITLVENLILVVQLTNTVFKVKPSTASCEPKSC